MPGGRVSARLAISIRIRITRFPNSSISRKKITRSRASSGSVRKKEPPRLASARSALFPALSAMASAVDQSIFAVFRQVLSRRHDAVSRRAEPFLHRTGLRRARCADRSGESQPRSPPILRSTTRTALSFSNVAEAYYRLLDAMGRKWRRGRPLPTPKRCSKRSRPGWRTVSQPYRTRSKRAPLRRRRGMSWRPFRVSKRLRTALSHRTRSFSLCSVSFQDVSGGRFPKRSTSPCKR